MTYDQFRETYSEGNPYASPQGGPQSGKWTEWDEWNQSAWARGIVKLSDEEREEGVHALLRFQHRCESEAASVADFETWKKKTLEENPWIVGQ